MPFSFASPEELAELSASLERAWAMLCQRRPDNPAADAGDRERLAYIVAALWQQGVRERAAEEAVEQFVVTAPSRLSLGGTEGDPLGFDGKI